MNYISLEWKKYNKTPNHTVFRASTIHHQGVHDCTRLYTIVHDRCLVFSSPANSIVACNVYGVGILYYYFNFNEIEWILII